MSGDGRGGSDGSRINALARQLNWIGEEGTPVTFRVGMKRETFGSKPENLIGPKLAGGYLPIVQMHYRDSGGDIYAQETFVDVDGDSPKLGVAFVRFALPEGREKGKVEAQFEGIGRATAKGGVLRNPEWSAVSVLFAIWALFGPVGMMIQEAAPRLPDWLGMYGRAQYVPQLMACYLPPGVVVLVIVSLLTPPPPRKQVNDFRLLLKTPVGQEQTLVDAGVRIVYAGNTQGHPWELKYPRLVHWGGFFLAVVVAAGIFGLLKLLMTIGG